MVSRKPSAARAIDHVSEQGGIALTGDIAPFWLRFLGFEPDRTASFEEEFDRLVKQEGWSGREARTRRVEAVSSELAYKSSNLGRLEQWRMFCQEVGITAELTSITQCKKALRSVHIDLSNLINRRRNPSVELVHFASQRELSSALRARKMLPRVAAKQAGPIRGLLIQVR